MLFLLDLDINQNNWGLLALTVSSVFLYFDLLLCELVWFLYSDL